MTDLGRRVDPAKLTPMRVVRLVKTDDVLGPLPVGSQYEYRYVELARETAVARAFRMLKRDNPNENPMCWTVEGDA